MTRFGLILLVGTGVPACKHPGACGGRDLLLEVAGNHGHAERITASALERGAVSYRLEGGSHDHSVRLGESTLARLAAGASVDLRSSSENGHVHALRLSCVR